MHSLQAMEVETSSHYYYFFITHTLSTYSMAGIALLKLYHRSPPLVIMGVYKEHEWAPWKFNSVPRRWWISQANQRRFCDWVFKQEGLKSLEDWYSVRASVIAKHGGMYIYQSY